MFFFLAFQNIAKNKKDTAIIAALIAVITFIFFTGNSIISKTEQSIRRTYIESCTGDIVLQKAGDITMNLYGANTPVIDTFFTIPVFPAYDTVMKIVSSESEIAGISSQVSGKAYLDVLGIREQVLLCGIDAATYFSIFPGILLEEGRFLQPGEYGAMITKEHAQRIKMHSGQEPFIGMPLLFTSAGSMGVKIREAPLTGIVKYQNPGVFITDIVLTDPQTVRALNSIQVAGFVDTDDADLMLSGNNFDDIFTDAFIFAGNNNDVEFSEDYLHDFLIDSKAGIKDAQTGGDWNFILLRLKQEKSAQMLIPLLNKKIEPYGVTAVNWRTAAGNSAILTLLVQALFNSGITLVCIVGIIAIINILLVSVFRRVREIGTLRAIGASDSFIRSLIYCENFFISVIAGFAGIFFGIIFIYAVNHLGIAIKNELIISVLDGSVLYIDFLPNIAVSSFSLAVFLGFAASIYPVETAVRLEPMTALRRG